MKYFLVLWLAVAAVVAESPILDYHERVGIPMATRIRQAEDAAIKSGSRISGGQPAPLGAHPYLVGLVITLEDRRISACGSSMVSNTRLLTAAHCWYIPSMQAEMFTLVFGSEYLFYGGVRVDTRDVEMHPDWMRTNWMEFESDIAVVRFSHVAYTDVIQPVALPTGELESNDFVGFWARASGYGMIGAGIGLQPNQVQSHVDLQVISNEVCNQFFSINILEGIICTSGVGGVGICSADSGGPLTIVHNNQFVLIGVSSFGGICGEGVPSGFVRVTEQLPWIRARL